LGWPKPGLKRQDKSSTKAGTWNVATFEYIWHMCLPEGEGLKPIPKVLSHLATCLGSRS
jgi:hypothetical protein